MPVWLASRNPRAAMFLVAALTVAAGCGTSDYNRRVLQSITRLQAGTAFTDLYAQSTAIPGTQIKVRLPLRVADGKAYDPATPGADQRQVQPPFMKLPGPKACYEMTAQDEGGATQTYYLYLAVLRPGEPVPGGGTLADVIQKQLTAAFPSSDPPQWTEQGCLTPAGVRVPWKMIKVSGDQDFYTGIPGSYQKAPGVFVLFLNEDPAGRVMIAWRVPKSLEKQVNVEGLAQAMGGTIESGAPAAP